jgi:hypothetical protein
MKTILVVIFFMLLISCKNKNSTEDYNNRSCLDSDIARFYCNKHASCLLQNDVFERAYIDEEARGVYFNVLLDAVIPFKLTVNEEQVIVLKVLEEPLYDCSLSLPTAEAQKALYSSPLLLKSSTLRDPQGTINITTNLLPVSIKKPCGEIEEKRSHINQNFSSSIRTRLRLEEPKLFEKWLEIRGYISFHNRLLENDQISPDQRISSLKEMISKEIQFLNYLSSLQEGLKRREASELNPPKKRKFRFEHEWIEKNITQKHSQELEDLKKQLSTLNVDEKIEEEEESVSNSTPFYDFTSSWNSFKNWMWDGFGWIYSL